MSEKPIIREEQVNTLLETKFIKVYDLQYEEGRHYFDATRREKKNIIAIKSDEEFKSMLPDAVTCAVILKCKGSEPVLLLTSEYRYPTGQFLLSPPAGLIDAGDAAEENPLFVAAQREIKEETGLDFKAGDFMKVVNPLLFSTPGLTDESNALILAVINVDNYEGLNTNGTEGSEKIEGFRLLTKDDATAVLESGRDENGIFYSVYTWAVLIYFVSGMWRETDKDYRRFSSEPEVADCGCIYG